MIDARECAALAEQCGEAAGEAFHEAGVESVRGRPMTGKAGRWLEAAEALSDAQEALQRASDAIAAVGLERG